MAPSEDSATRTERLHKMHNLQLRINLTATLQSLREDKPHLAARTATVQEHTRSTAHHITTTELLANILQSNLNPRVEHQHASLVSHFFPMPIPWLIWIPMTREKYEIKLPMTTNVCTPYSIREAHQAIKSISITFKNHCKHTDPNRPPSSSEQ